MSIEEEAKKFMSDKEKQADQINGLTCRQELAADILKYIILKKGTVLAYPEIHVQDSFRLADMILSYKE